MNIKKLNHLLSQPGSKAKLCRTTGISRPTIDSIINGSDFKVSNLEKIASALNVKVGYFFDEDVTEIRRAGRDFNEEHDKVRHDKIVQRNAASTGEIACNQNDLVEALRNTISVLENQVKDKEHIIALMKSQRPSTDIEAPEA